MLKAFRSRLTYANLMASGAMFVALGGGAYALTGSAPNVVFRRVVGPVTASNSFNEATAKCRTGERLIGGGGGFVRTGEFVYVSGRIYSGPAGPPEGGAGSATPSGKTGTVPRGWSVGGFNTDSVSARPYAFAICAKR
jgi:hypothetical protein